MTDRSDAIALLRKALEDDTATFRDGQWEAIDALVNRKERLLVVQRTGWGKSIIYFIATCILRNRKRTPTLTLIISPLLALMRNQIEAAERLGIRALTINSTNQPDWEELEDKVLNNEADALLISPERLANDRFVEKVLSPSAENISLLVVDEAHCISDWGHDFRPDYRRLVNVLQKMPDNIPILGTTATANNRVIKDIKIQLGEIEIQRGPLMRSTLALQNIPMPAQARLAWLVDHMDALPGTGIIYTLTKRDANQVARWLNKNDIVAKAYYSGVECDEFEDSNAYRLHLEDMLLRNDIKALVATSALGMGYDKPDLGFVVHYQAPGSVITYYQQVGRAGRGIDHAVGILMSGNEDDKIHEYFRRSAFPHEDWVKLILKALEESDGLSIFELQKEVNLRHGQIEQVLKFLLVDSPPPVIKSGSKWQRTPVQYKMDHDHIQRRTKQREAEWHEVQNYINERGCLMEFLARALDDDDPKPCGKCASCLGTSVVDHTFNHKTAALAGRFLRHSEIELKLNIMVAKNAFVEYDLSGKIHKDQQAKVGRILSRWGDAGYGQIVANGKNDNHFPDKLVDAVVEMIRRWQPTPFPTWITCVPSRNHPTLVPDFTRRLAHALKLPFLPVVTKVKDNEPQKMQQNRFHQCKNLDGVFAIVGDVQNEPVFLVDDVVDSGWTLTVISTLLRQASSGPVWPLALTTSSMGA